MKKRYLVEEEDGEGSWKVVGVAKAQDPIKAMLAVYPTQATNTPADCQQKKMRATEIGHTWYLFRFLFRRRR